MGEMGPYQEELFLAVSSFLQSVQLLSQSGDEMETTMSTVPRSWGLHHREIVSRARLIANQTRNATCCTSVLIDVECLEIKSQTARRNLELLILNIDRTSTPNTKELQCGMTITNLAILLVKSAAEQAHIVGEQKSRCVRIYVFLAE
jgi:hypothetical protein